MSQQNVEALRQALDAYNRRDIDAFMERFDPMVETHPLNLAMFAQEATVYHGHDGIRRFIGDVDEVLSEIQVEVVEIRDLGERIVARGRLHARGRASGAEIDSPIGWVVDFASGKVVRMRDYPDFTGALKAAGLQE
jgi:ketosteroid isomerase-like protein